MEKDIQFRKNFIWNILGTGFNAFNSLFFLITVTRINGVDNAGIFTIAYSTACILFIIGTYVGRIYQVTETNNSITDKDFIFNRFITVISMNIFVFIFCFIRGYDGYKILTFFLLTLFKSIEAFSDVLYGVLQKNDKLELVGKSLFYKSGFSILFFIIIDLIFNNMIISIISINLVWLAFLILYDFKNTKEYINFSVRVNWKNVLNIFKSGFTTFGIAFLGIYILNSPKYAIDSYLANNLQTIFGIIVMPATVIGLVAQFLIHPFLNSILNLYEERNLKKLNILILKLISVIVVFGIISSLLAYFLGPLVLGFIYGLDLNLYRLSLLIIIISSTLYTIGTIFSSVLTTVRETFSQFILYIIISIFALLVSNVFTKKWGLDGAVWSYLCIMSLQFLLYTIYTNIRLKFIFNKKN